MEFVGYLKPVICLLVAYYPAEYNPSSSYLADLVLQGLLFCHRCHIEDYPFPNKHTKSSHIKTIFRVNRIYIPFEIRLAWFLVD